MLYIDQICVCVIVWYIFIMRVNKRCVTVYRYYVSFVELGRN